MSSGTIQLIAILSIPAVFLIYNVVKEHAYTDSARDARDMAIIEPFGGSEDYRGNIAAFYKWTGVLARMDARTKTPQPWVDNRNSFADMTNLEVAQKVNNTVNRYRYIADIVNWDKSDYWATPTEFFNKGGDCEDFVIAKYAWLRFLGVPEDRLRLAIVHDRIQGTPHAVLLTYINDKVMVLDNQVQEIRDSASINRYRLIYSINRSGWWYPEKRYDSTFAMREDIESVAPASGDGKEVQFFEECLGEEAVSSCINDIEPSAG